MINDTSYFLFLFIHISYKQLSSHQPKRFTLREKPLVLLLSSCLHLVLKRGQVKSTQPRRISVYTWVYPETPGCPDAFRSPYCLLYVISARRSKVTVHSLQLC